MCDFFLFAGPNGSGKSTIINNFLLKNKVAYLNADYCARTDPSISDLPDGLEKSVLAQKETERRLKEKISSKEPFIWETVFSHESRLEIMDYAKSEGYMVHLTYITTKHPDICVARVKQRVSEGGHDIPEDKIRNRYSRSLSFLPEMIISADEVLIYDNSYENTDPKLLFQKLIEPGEGGGPGMIVWKNNDPEVDGWVMENVFAPLDKRGIPVECYELVPVDP